MKDDGAHYVTAYYSLFSFSGGPQGAAPQQKTVRMVVHPRTANIFLFSLKQQIFTTFFIEKSKNAYFLKAISPIL
ncbi:MAG: hypothetical protein IJF46_00695 [Bacteroidaceae bacterium]|nr:hypothetical protein [Bacteroidaceae bacterium]